MCKNAVTKLTFATKYVSDRYKTQEMCDNVILDNGGTLNVVSDYYQNQKRCNKAVDYYVHLLEFAPNCSCNKAVDTYTFAIK